MGSTAATDRTLYLVDGTYNIFRAYYAIRSLTSPDGTPTNAVFGFTNMLRKLIRERAPEYLAVAFDQEGPTHRDEVFEEYKANRPAPPEDLVRQMPLAPEVCRVLGVPVLELPGYEADDVIGTLAERARAEGFRVVIVTADKDLYQLVDSDRVVVLNPHKDDLLLDEATVEEVWGVAPSHVVDVLALWGDPSDNIPGVPGIGEKGAKKLVNLLGDLETILERIDEVPGKKARESLRENAERARLSRRLAEIVRDAPVEGRPEDLRLREPDRPAALELFRRLGFRGLSEEMAAPAEAAAPHGEADYHAILAGKELEDFVRRVREAGAVAVDTETDSLDAHRATLVGISLCVTPREAVYVPLGHTYDGAPSQLSSQAVRDLLDPVFRDPGIRKVGQNLKYDLTVLRRWGTDLDPVSFDTLVAAHLVDPSRRSHSLDDLALTYLDHRTIHYEEVAGKGKEQRTLDQVEVDAVTPYAAEDADVALRLAERLAADLERLGLEELFETVEMPLVPILTDMESRGVRLEIPVLEAMSGEMAGRLSALEEEIHDLAGEPFNVSSPQQLREVLFERLELTPTGRRTAKTRALSTSQDVLEQLAEQHPLPGKVLEYRELAKLKSTYVDALPALVNPETGRLHTSFQQLGAATGRLSSSDPNLQNIPVRTETGRRIRRAFVPEEGWLFLSADYSQVELRVLAHLAEEPELLRAFERGEDIHRRTAALVAGVGDEEVTREMRSRAKAVNFGILYGMSEFRLAREQEMSRPEARAFIEAYFERLPRVREYIDEVQELAKESGEVSTLFGRIRRFPELRGEGGGRGGRVAREQALRAAVNTTIQGTAADLMKMAMIRVHRALGEGGLEARMLLQVHDELLFEAPPKEMKALRDLVRREMEGVYPLRAPLRVDLHEGKDWMEAK